MTNETELYKTLIDLYQFSAGHEANELIRSELIELLDHNNFLVNENVPDWLLTFFKKIIKESPIEAVEYVSNQPLQGDIINLLSELEDIIPAQWEDDGESLAITFGHSSVVGYIMFEGNNYAVRL